MKTKFDTNEDLLIHIRESKYEGSLPYFYDQKDFPELSLIKDNWPLILEEVRNYEKRCGDITGMNTYTPPDLSSDNAWNNMYFDNYMWRFHTNRKHFPKTCQLLDQIPGCTHSGISVLSPYSAIAGHYGDTNAVIRCHLGLHIPAPFPDCGIQVGSEKQGWANGELTVFTEAHYHTTWNQTPERRYLLIFDIIHPKWKGQEHKICSRVLGAQTYVFFENKIPILKKLPDSILHPFHRLLSLLWYIYLYLSRG